VALFEAMAADVVVPEVLRAYARISLAYRSLKDDNLPLAQALIPALNAQVQELLSDPESLRCQRSNRRNRFKLLVSSLTALTHLQLLLGEQSGLQVSADQLLALLEPHPWQELPADVAFRLLTNTCRCLGWAALLAWRCQNRERLQAILMLLDALQREAWADRHRHSAAQENHRAYVAQMRWRVAALLEPAGERGDRQQENPGWVVALWALNVTTPALQQRLEALVS
jgi:hypothetical protein